MFRPTALLLGIVLDAAKVGIWGCGAVDAFNVTQRNLNCPPSSSWAVCVKVLAVSGKARKHFCIATRHLGLLFRAVMEFSAIAEVFGILIWLLKLS